MRNINNIKYLFTIIGIGLLIGTFFTYINTSNFVEIAITSQGTVVDLVELENSSNSISYKPLVQFIDKTGKRIEFLSPSSSNPPSYQNEEKVEVLYNPDSPNDAKLKGLFSIWGGTIIMGILGVTLTIIGVSIFIFDKKKNDTLKYLQQNGTTIETDFQIVDINLNYTVNGQNPYQIVSEWINPSTSKLHVFTSDNIWFDPTKYIKTEKIKVLIDINNPEKYWVDLAFLP